MKIAQSLFITPFLLASHLHAGIGTELLYKGLERPVWAGAPVSEKGKLWVMEQAGSIWIIDLKTGSGQREGLSVTGGFVYRCSKAATFLQTTRTPGSGRS